LPPHLRLQPDAIAFFVVYSLAAYFATYPYTVIATM